MIWLSVLAGLSLFLYLRGRADKYEVMSEDWLRRFIGETPHDGRARDAWGSK